jgi:hypothetical protein
MPEGEIRKPDVSIGRSAQTDFSRSYGSVQFRTSSGRKAKSIWSAPLCRGLELAALYRPPELLFVELALGASISNSWARGSGQSASWPTFVPGDLFRAKPVSSLSPKETGRRRNGDCARGVRPYRPSTCLRGGLPTSMQQLKPSVPRAWRSLGQATPTTLPGNSSGTSAGP